MTCRGAAPPRPGSSRAAVSGSVATTTASARAPCRRRCAPSPAATARTAGARWSRSGAEPAGQLLADRLHAVGGQADRAADEAAPQQVEVAAGGGQLVLEQHAGEEGPEEALQGRVADAGGRAARPPRVRSGRAQQPAHRCVPGPERRRRRAPPCPRSEPIGARGRAEHVGRALPRVDHPVGPAVDPDHRAALEPAQLAGRRGRGRPPAGSRCSAPGSPRSTTKPSTRSVASRPPAWPPASSTCTSHPAAASRVAADRPASPAPTTTTSARGTTSCDGSRDAGRPRGSTVAGRSGLWTTGAGGAPVVLRSPACLPPSRPGPGTAAPPVVPGYTLEALLGRGGSGRGLAGGPAARAASRSRSRCWWPATRSGRRGRRPCSASSTTRTSSGCIEVVHQPRRGGAARVALVLELLAGGSLAGAARPARAAAPGRGGDRDRAGRGGAGPRARATASSTATSRRATSSSPPRAGRSSPTSGWPGCSGEAAAAEVTPPYVDPTVARGGAPGPGLRRLRRRGRRLPRAHRHRAVERRHPGGHARGRGRRATCPTSPSWRPDAPPELVAVIERGLSADPHDRGSAAAFALDLRHACRPEPVRLPVAGVPDAELGRTGRGAADRADPPGARAPGPRPRPSWSSRPGAATAGGARLRDAAARRRPSVVARSRSPPACSPPCSSPGGSGCAGSRAHRTAARTVEAAAAGDVADRAAPAPARAGRRRGPPPRTPRPPTGRSGRTRPSAGGRWWPTSTSGARRRSARPRRSALADVYTDGQPAAGGGRGARPRPGRGRARCCAASRPTVVAVTGGRRRDRPGASWTSSTAGRTTRWCPPAHRTARRCGTVPGRPESERAHGAGAHRRGAGGSRRAQRLG